MSCANETAHRKIFFCSVIASGTNAGGADYPEEIPFVSTPVEVIDKMLELAEVKSGDVLYDFGSGDGRIVIRPAQKYGIRAVGIEMDRLLLDQARRDAKNSSSPAAASSPTTSASRAGNRIKRSSSQDTN